MLYRLSMDLYSYLHLFSLSILLSFDPILSLAILREAWGVRTVRRLIPPMTAMSLSSTSTCPTSQMQYGASTDGNNVLGLNKELNQLHFELKTLTTEPHCFSSKYVIQYLIYYCIISYVNS